MCDTIVFLWKSPDSEDHQESLIITTNVILLSFANELDRFVEDSYTRIIEKYISDFGDITKKQLRSFKKNLFWVIYNKKDTRFWKKDSSFLSSFSKKEHLNLNKEIKAKAEIEIKKAENAPDGGLSGLGLGFFFRSKN